MNTVWTELSEGAGATLASGPRSWSAQVESLAPAGAADEPAGTIVLVVVGEPEIKTGAIQVSVPCSGGELVFDADVTELDPLPTPEANDIFTHRARLYVERAGRVVQRRSTFRVTCVRPALVTEPCSAEACETDFPGWEVIEGRPGFQTVTVDISLGGSAVVVPGRLRPDTELRLSVELGDQGLVDRKVIVANWRLDRLGRTVTGLRFSDLSPREETTLSRFLVEQQRRGTPRVTAILPVTAEVGRKSVSGSITEVSPGRCSAVLPKPLGLGDAVTLTVVPSSQLPAVHHHGTVVACYPHDSKFHLQFDLDDDAAQASRWRVLVEDLQSRLGSVA